MTATPNDPTSIRLGNGIVTFDGAVVEFFGFFQLESHRVHVGILKDIEIADRHLLGTAINVSVLPSGSWQVVPSFQDDQRQRFELLIAEIHAARDAWPSQRSG